MPRRKKDQPLLPVEPIVDPLVCRECGSSQWKFSYETAVEFDVNHTSATGEVTTGYEKIQCASCGLKATKNNNAHVRATLIFQVAERECKSHAAS